MTTTDNPLPTLEVSDNPLSATNTLPPLSEESANPSPVTPDGMDMDEPVEYPANDNLKHSEPSKMEQEDQDDLPKQFNFEKEWGQILPIYLDELLRLEAPLEKEEGSLYCETCDATFSDVRGEGLYRCIQCNTSVECVSCVLNRHKKLPLHTIHQWTGEFYEEVTLRSLGLVHHLGHRGSLCPAPCSEIAEVAVIDATGIHSVAVQFCNCGATHGNYVHAQQLLGNLWYPLTASDPSTCVTFAVFETFRALNDACGVTIDQFLTALRRSNVQVEVKDTEECVDPDIFECALRGYTTIMQAKNSGDYLHRNHSSANPSILMCWACPHEGLNIPTNPRQFTEPDNKYLFTLMLALESKSRRYLLMKPDPPHGPSLAQAHLFANPKLEKRVATPCQTFLVRKRTQEVSPDDASGIIASLCARHDVVRFGGLGNFVEGETFRDADNTFLSAVQGTHFDQIIVSYDAACTWENHFRDRLVEYPDKLQLDPDTKVEFQLPHRCKPTSGPIPSECPGRIWAHPGDKRASALWASLRNTLHMTKTLSDGAQTDWIVHGTEYHNLTKNLGIGQALLDRLRDAEENYYKSSHHVANIECYLKREVKSAWSREMKSPTWTGSMTYPLLPEHSRPFSRHFNKAGIDTENLQNWPEIKDSSGGRTISLVGFVAFGIQIEDLQTQVTTDPSQEDRRRSSLTEKLEKFRGWQADQMPDAFQMAAKMADPSSPTQPELTKLWLPSELPSPGDATMFGKIELALRVGQCKDALEALVIALLKARWSTHLPTEAQDALLSYAKACTAIYQRGWTAIASLKGDLKAFPDLTKVDVTQRVEGYSSSRFVRQVDFLIDSSRVIQGEFERQVDDFTKATWTRAAARRTRWAEEIALLKEEMKRTLRFLAYQANWWEDRLALIHGDKRSPRDIMLGRQGHALRQNAFLRKVSAQFKSLWSPYINVENLYELPV